MLQNEEKCKWCGQSMPIENSFGEYCCHTCKIAAMEENPEYIRRRRTRQISIVVGAFYALLLCLIDGNLSQSSFLFYASAGALIGWGIGFGLGFGIYFFHKQNNSILNKRIFEK